MPDSTQAQPIPATRADLDQILAEAWALLRQGAADRRSPFHTMTVATVRQDGAPAARTVVVRGVDPDRRVLRFHTDRRAPKLDDIMADSRVGLLLYDPGRRLQFRIDGVAAIHGEGALPDSLWDRTPLGSRTYYRQPTPPGGRLDGPGQSIPPQSGPQDGREHFTVVEVAVQRLDWLFLNADGHRRALFDLDGEGVLAHWVAP